MKTAHKVRNYLPIALVAFFLPTLSPAYGADVDFPGGFLCDGNIAYTYVNADDDDTTGVSVGGIWYPNETQVALYHIQGNIDLSGDEIYFSHHGDDCGETGYWTQKGKFVIRFIDALAPGWVYDDPSTWQEKQIDRAEFILTHNVLYNYLVYAGLYHPATIANPSPYQQATAYEHWRQGGAVVDTAAVIGFHILEGVTGFSEIYFSTDYAENTVLDLQIFADACPHPVGHIDYCRDCGPCDLGQGDCDNDGECQGRLKCHQVEGTDICGIDIVIPACPPVGHLDYCRACGPCAEGQGDCDSDSECQDGLTCPDVPGTDTCQSGPPACPHPIGHLDYCRDCGPCAEGQGDCDSDSECQDGLTCPDVPGTDTCQSGPPACPHPVGHLDYCRDCGPCAAGQGDCDNDGECQSGLSCVQVSGTDVCCPHPLGHLDYCRDCGPCGSGQGDCDSDSECQSGLTCVQVPGTDTCQ
jgi:hypothetical protein